ncbi:hypothetical protein Pmani_037780 [Petrolisthes manimaculis]|uniref:Pseudouridine synthase I TruA alpha/beta domain-containing protein n=1 Tax=Petrolisthes manimaculis TaxID=1843537 RepID=A0AAE1NHM3_9EUCA|nr:hypothetical protein Pmani_037780 [Petrolisthes manimaculis]
MEERSVMKRSDDQTHTHTTPSHQTHKLQPPHQTHKLQPPHQTHKTHTHQPPHQTHTHQPPHKTHKLQPLHQLTREELEARVQQLEAHNKQLRNLLAKNHEGQQGQQHNTHTKVPRPFDFTKHSRRHVVLKFAYLGWDYHGFATQEDTNQTIEAKLFPALLKTRLIQSRQTSNYHRCGRTDKGVSAFEQVISITVRSKCQSGVGVEAPQCTQPNTQQAAPQCAHPNTQEDNNNDDNDDHHQPSHKDNNDDDDNDDDTQELNYVQMLNRVLPSEIRMLAWSPVPCGYSARFDCSSRTYKYFFPRATLNLEVMCEAARCLVGQHDFRNFCKMDVANGVVSFQHYQNVTTLVRSDPNKGYEMCVATIEGEAFLWHQIRCIMAVLLMVGEGKESPQVVTQLLNVNKHPRKPQYTMASEVPLNLYGSSFDGVSWRWDDMELYLNISHFQNLWAQQAIKASMISRMLWDLEHRYQHSHPHTTTTTPPPVINHSHHYQQHSHPHTTTTTPPPVTNHSQRVVTTRETTNEAEIDNEEQQAVKEKDDDGDQQKETKQGKLNRETTVDDNRDRQKKTKQGKLNREKTETDYGDQQKETKLQRKVNKEKTVYGCQKVTQGTTPPPPLPQLPQHQIECLIQGAKRKVHQPLLSRPTCESLETRVQHYVKRQRLGPEVLQKLTSRTTTTSNNKEVND